MGILDYLLVSMISSGIKSASDQASWAKEEAKFSKGAEAAGLSVYAYVKSTLSDGMRATMEDRAKDIESLGAYLHACREQKLLTDYTYSVLWEEEKGRCALRRLQATGGNPWNPHDILRGLAPEKILNQCDRDAASYGLQIVYLDQQVVQENVTRQTADLILNVYKLAREE